MISLGRVYMYQYLSTYNAIRSQENETIPKILGFESLPSPTGSQAPQSDIYRSGTALPSSPTTPHPYLQQVQPARHSGASQSPSLKCARFVFWPIAKLVHNVSTHFHDPSAIKLHDAPPPILTTKSSPGNISSMKKLRL